MKAIAIALGVVVVIAAAIFIRGNGEPLRYVKSTVEVVKEVEVTPDWAKDEDAVKAAQAVIRKKELEAELSNLTDTFASTTETYETEKKQYQERKKELEIELGTY